MSYCEDSKYYGGETINITVTDTVVIPVEVSLTLSRDKDYELNLEDLNEVLLDPNGSFGCISVTTGWEEERY